jgi:hypothetical protein
MKLMRFIQANGLGGRSIQSHKLLYQVPEFSRAICFVHAIKEQQSLCLLSIEGFAADAAVGAPGLPVAVIHDPLGGAVAQFPNMKEEAHSIAGSSALCSPPVTSLAWRRRRAGGDLGTAMQRLGASRLIGQSSVS